MNQTPNPYGVPAREPEPPAAHDRLQGNPYLDLPGQAAMPDLEANAPVLRASEVQRLNRKALLFLAGIIGLLILMAVWVFSGATGRGSRDQAAPESEEVRIPALPQAPGEPAPAMASAEPIGVESYESASALPPLPPQPVHVSPAYGPPPYEPSAQASRPPTLMERRMGLAAGQPAGQGGSAQDAYLQAMLATTPGAGAGAERAPHQESPSRAATPGVRYLQQPDALLVRGTYIRCVLETHIVTDVPGYTSCVLTEPVYSINGRTLLLPRGSKAVGRYQSGPDGPRVAVVWDRITTPTGMDVSMASPGVDGLGGAGHPGDYDAHWGSRISSALLISLLSDAFKYYGAQHGPRTTIATGTNVVEMPFESNTARTVQGLAEQALTASADRRPTVTIHQGEVVNIYVARDIDFSGVLASR